MMESPVVTSMVGFLREYTAKENHAAMPMGMLAFAMTLHIKTRFSRQELEEESERMQLVYQAMQHINEQPMN
jgi:hypothetical protein